MRSIVLPWIEKLQEAVSRMQRYIFMTLQVTNNVMLSDATTLKNLGVSILRFVEIWNQHTISSLSSYAQQLFRASMYYRRSTTHHIQGETKRLIGLHKFLPITRSRTGWNTCRGIRLLALTYYLTVLRSGAAVPRTTRLQLLKSSICTLLYLVAAFDRLKTWLPCIS